MVSGALQVTQVKHAFPFGSAIDANKLYRDDPGFHLYREYFYNMFNWAVLKNDVKWRFMETEEVSKPSRPFSEPVEVCIHCAQCMKQIAC